MTKTKGFLLTAGIVLATTFTLSCSDDKDDFKYLSCEELGSLMGGNPDAYMSDLADNCKTTERPKIQQQCLSKPNEAEIDKCARNIVMACIEKDEKVKKLCGGNDLEACNEHYDTMKCGGSYLSCEELGSLMGGDPDAYVDNLKSICAGSTTCVSKDENIKKACSGNSLEACRKNYAEACGIWN